MGKLKRLGILAIDPIDQEDFRALYPEAQIFDQASTALLKCEAICLIENYAIKDDYFQILDVWRSYLSKHDDFQRIQLFLAANQTQPHPNLLNLYQLPENTDFLDHALTIAQLEERKNLAHFPVLPDPDILEPLEGIMAYHGDDNFHSLLIDLRIQISLFHKLYDGGKSWDELIRQGRQEKIKKIHHALNDLWSFSKPYFALLPFYTGLLRFVDLQASLLPFLQLKGPDPQVLKTLPELINRYGQYLDEEILTICNLYGIAVEGEEVEEAGTRGDILVIDDEDSVFQDFKATIKAHDVHYANSHQAARAFFKRRNVDLALVDLNLKLVEEEASEGEDSENLLDKKRLDKAIDQGMAYIDELHKSYPNVKIVVVSKHKDTDRILQAGRYGADKFYYKGTFDSRETDFLFALNRLIKEKKAADQLVRDRERIIWGNHPKIVSLREKLDVYAKNLISFWVMGAPGSGKSNLLQSLVYAKNLYEANLYQASTRKKKREYVLYQTDLSETPMNTQGEIEQATDQLSRSGVWYLKHFELASPVFQRFLAEAFKERTHLQLRKGKNEVELQVVAHLATPPEQLLKEENLLNALYNRFPLHQLPSLAERPTDIKPIIQGFLKSRGCKPNILHRDQYRQFARYHYPGNTAELIRMLEEMLAAHKEIYHLKYSYKPVDDTSLPRQLIDLPQELDFDRAVAEVELRLIDLALQRHDGKKDLAAKSLNGRNSDNLLHFIKKYKDKYPNLIRKYSWIKKVYKRQLKG